MLSRYNLLCLASGGVWASIACLLGCGMGPPWIWGPIVVSPLIGVVAGAIYLPAYRFPIAGRLAMSLLTLYLSAALFGLAWGITDAVGAMGDAGGRRNTIEVVYQGLVGTFYGVTFTGFVVLLWPLAHLNHWFVGRFTGHPLTSTGPPDEA